MNKIVNKKSNIIIIIGFLLSTIFVIYPLENVKAEEFNSDDLAYAILVDNSTLLSSSYIDTAPNNEQVKIISSLGSINPAEGTDFIIISTGVAGTIATDGGGSTGSERGTWFGPQHPGPWGTFDEATLTLELKVPDGMKYLYYTSQFFSTEAPEWIDEGYNDKLTITVNSPNKGITTHIIDVDENGGNLVLDSYDLTGTGFDLFAKIPGTSTPTGSDNIDWVSTSPGNPGWDAGATYPVDSWSPVYPGETVTFAINIKDAGDNQLDSAAIIDKVEFVAELKANITAVKTVEDVNGGIVKQGDVLDYSIFISNIGNADQKDNPGDEFEDILPDEVTYVDGSASAYSAVGNPDDPVYDPAEKKITWNGEIPSSSTTRLEFSVTINQDAPEGSVISNQGFVYWDDTDDEIDENNAVEYSDDPDIDDGADQDGDGYTNDDDPTNITIFKPPDYVTEDFTDDEPGCEASEIYEGETWFETTKTSGEGNFEIASDYFYQTPRSFKTKMRSSSSPQYWNYSFSGLHCNVSWWEINFACGNASNNYDLTLNFKDNNENDITLIKIEYIQAGNQPPNDWLLNLSFWDPDENKWIRLASDFENGYLFNDWYKLKIEENEQGNLDYKLNRTGKGLVASKTGGKLDSSLSNLASVKWDSSYNAVVCPIFFWDEHNIGLNALS